MLFRKRKNDPSIDDVVRFVIRHMRELEKKSRKAFDEGRKESGRWWDCQACAMLTLLDALKDEYGCSWRKIREGKKCG